MKKAAILISAALLCLGQVKSEETPASQAATASAPVELSDLLTGAIDPYESGAQRALFYKAAGSDSELSKEEFQADAARGGFIRPFDKWDSMLKFDKNGSGTIDWFEADAYRQAIRKDLLAKYDLDKDGRLKGDERIAANRALHGVGTEVDGRRSSVLIASSTPASGEAAAGGEDVETDPMKKYDADGDGKLSDEERKAMYEDMRRRNEQRLLERYDTNRDGKLDEQESKVKEHDEQDRREHQKEYAKAVEKLKITHFDRDGDGKLSAEEQAELDEFGRGIEKVNKEWELAAIDLDGDGKITQEERDEFQKQMRGMAFKITAKMIKYGDTNGDGKVSPEEMEALGRKIQDRMLVWMEDQAAKYDRNADGKLLDKAERQALLDGFSDEVKDKVKKFDADKDGRLSPQEMLNLLDDFVEHDLGMEPTKPASRPAE